MALNSSLKNLFSKDSAMTWRDWRMLAIFVVTFGGLFVLADEIHWQSHVAYSRLTTAADGKLIGVLARSIDLTCRNRIYIFDDELQLKKSIRLRSNLWLSSHALSEDGKYLLYLADDRSPDLKFELVSLDGSQAPVRIVLSGANVAKSLGHAWRVKGINGLQLIGNPPKQFLLHTYSELLLIDLAGQIISYVDDVSEECAISNRKYATTAATIGHDYDLLCYSIDPESLKLVLREPVSIDPKLKRFAISTNGLLAVQDLEQIRIIDLRKNELADRQRAIPWTLEQGSLTAINEDGKILLMDNETSMAAVSSQDLAVVGNLSLPNRIYADFSKRLDERRLVFSKSGSEGQSSALVIWDWQSSTTKEVSPANHSEMTMRVIDFTFIAIILVWAGCFFVASVRAKNVCLGIVTLGAALMILIRWTYLAPGTEELIIPFDTIKLIVLPMLCQVGLSIGSLWSVRYVRFVWALAIIVIAASFAAHWYNSMGFDFFAASHSLDGRFYFRNMVFVFAIEMILVQSLLVWRSTKESTLSIGDLLIMTVAAAIATKLLIGVRFQHNVGMIGFGLLGGTINLLQTLYAARIAKAPLRGRYLMWLFGYFAILFFVGYTLYACHIRMPARLNFWLSLLLSYSGAFLLTWLLLRLVYRYFEAPDRRDVEEIRLEAA